MSLKLLIEKSKQIAEGRHEAEISGIGERTAPFHYMDVYFKLENGVEVKEGFSAQITENSKLGKFIVSLGFPLTVGEEFELESLKGKRVSLMTMNEVSKNGTFAKIVEGSIKPLVPVFYDNRRNAIIVMFKKSEEKVRLA